MKTTIAITLLLNLIYSHHAQASVISCQALKDNVPDPTRPALTLEALSPFDFKVGYSNQSFLLHAFPAFSENENGDQRSMDEPTFNSLMLVSEKNSFSAQMSRFDPDSEKPAPNGSVYIAVSTSDPYDLYLCPNEAIPFLNPPVIASATVESGYTSPKGAFVETCVIGDDGEVRSIHFKDLSAGEDYLQKSYRHKKLKAARFAEIKTLLNEAKSAPLSVKRYACDPGSAELKGYENGKSFVINAGYDCGNRFERKTPTSDRLNQAIKSACKIDVQEMLID
jgi:hypothetical protein